MSWEQAMIVKSGPPWRYKRPCIVNSINCIKSHTSAYRSFNDNPLLFENALCASALYRAGFFRALLVITRENNWIGAQHEEKIVAGDAAAIKGSYASLIAAMGNSGHETY